MWTGCGVEKKVSLLVVDDDPNMLDSLSEVLDMEGFEVRTAATAAAAVQQAQGAAPDVLLTDYQLPDASGFELASKINKLLPAVPLMLFTGRTLSPQEKESGRACGVREFVVKPFDMPSLVALLRTMAPKEK